MKDDDFKLLRVFFLTDKLTIGQSFVNVESLLGLKIESVSQE